MGSFILIASILSFRVGMGVDQVSARYMVEDGDTVYLDNAVNFFIDQQQDWFSGRLDLSNLAVGGALDITKGIGNFTFSSDLEIHRYHSPDSLHLNQGLVDIALEFDPGPLGCRLSGRVDHYFDANRYFQNLNGIGGDLFWNFDRFDRRISLQFGSTFNQIPDSTILSHIKFGPDLDIFFNFNWITFSGLVFTRRVLYRDSINDHSELNCWLEFTEPICGWFGLYEEGDFDAYYYDHDNDVIFDRQKLMLGLGPEFKFLNNGLILRVGPRLRSEKNHPLGVYHDYVELSLLMKIELFFGGFSLFLENEYGHREYDMEFYVANTNYEYDELSLIGDMSLFGNWNLQLFTSYGPEWHSLPQDNSSFLILSSQVAYRF